MKNSQRAPVHRILALLTLARKLPAPIRKVIGNLSNTERVLVGRDLRPRCADPCAVWKREKHVE